MNSKKRNNDVCGFIVKSDELFYEGLVATLASIRHWYPNHPIRIIDCGLSSGQLSKLGAANFTDMVKPDLSGFTVANEMQHYYTRSIYSLLACKDELFDLSIHIDADAVLLQPIPDLLHLNENRHGLAAVPDYPGLGLDFQIGKKPNVLKFIKEIIPNIDVSSRSFNGGVFALHRSYYIDSIFPVIERLMHLHNELWGNEMAMLNLAAFAANPDNPFLSLDYTYNHRPKFRRAPTLTPTKLSNNYSELEPVLLGHFGRIKILHFVGKEKPWHVETEQTPSHFAWKYYRKKAEAVYGL